MGAGRLVGPLFWGINETSLDGIHETKYRAEGDRWQRPE